MVGKQKIKIVTAVCVVLFINLVAFAVLANRIDREQLLGCLLIGTFMFSASVALFLFGALPSRALAASDMEIRIAFIFACLCLAYLVIQIPLWIYMTHQFGPAALGSGTNEIFVSARDGNQIATHKIAGDGSMVNPFHGDLDAIIESLPPHTVINLYPGIFYTQRFSENSTNIMGIYLKEGDILKGSGRFATEIISPTNCTAVNTNGQLDMISNGLPGKNDHVTVENLTVDCGPYSTNCKVNGVILTGDGNVIKNVRCLNSYGSSSRHDEGFALACWPSRRINSTGRGNKIIGCVVIPNTSPDAYSNAYIDGIIIEGHDATVAGCDVYMPRLTNGFAPWYCGINVGQMKDGLVRNNRIHGGSVSIYDDTWRMTNVIFDGNFVQGGVFGMYFNGPLAIGNNVKVINNFFNETTNVFKGLRGGIIVYNTSTNFNPWRELTISGNTIDDNYQPIGLIQRNTGTNNFVGVQVINNIINGKSHNTLATTNIFVSGNVDQLGTPYNFNGITNESFLPRNIMVGGAIKTQFQ